ncbi:unnamed protein product [Parajaminaea phylloscopi]
MAFPAFTPVQSLVGGLMLSAAVNGLLINTGQPLGISGFFHNVVQSTTSRSRPVRSSADRNMAVGLVLGLLAGGACIGLAGDRIEDLLSIRMVEQPSQTSTPSVSLWTDLAAGLLVGAGARLGSGCTSGHFLCGISRFSPRSILATAVFFTVAVLTRLYVSASAVGAGVFSATLKGPSEDLWPTAPSQVAPLALLQSPWVIYGLVVPILARTWRNDPAVQARLAGMTAFACGLHFAFGLAMAGMLQADKVTGFLSLSAHSVRSGVWDPSLAMVALGGIPSAAWYWSRNVKPKVEAFQKTKDPSQAPTLAACTTWAGSLHSSRARLITPRLVVGAVIFGVGWGISGFCPGPALVNLARSGVDGLTRGDGGLSELSQVALFVAAMAAGGVLADRV